MPRPELTESIVRMADPARNPNAEERGVALTMLGFGGDMDVTDREALLTTARNALIAASYALGQANGVEDIVTARDMASHVQKYVRDRKLGIEAENVAAEIVFLAEYKAGKELIRMADEGERAVAGKVDGNQYHTGVQRAAVTPPTLRDLGLSEKLTRTWQTLARQYPDAESLRHTIEVSVVGDPDKRLSRSKLLAYTPERDTRLTRDDARARRALAREALRDPVRDGIQETLDSIMALRGILDNGAIATLEPLDRASLFMQLAPAAEVMRDLWAALRA